MMYQSNNKTNNSINININGNNNNKQQHYHLLFLHAVFGLFNRFLPKYLWLISYITFGTQQWVQPHFQTLPGRAEFYRLPDGMALFSSFL